MRDVRVGVERDVGDRVALADEEHAAREVAFHHGEGVVAELGIEIRVDRMRADRAHDERVAVGRGLGDDVAADVTACAGAVVRVGRGALDFLRCSRTRVRRKRDLVHLLCFLFAAIVAAILFHRPLRDLSAAGWKAGAWMGLFLTGGYLFQTFGLERTTASHAGFITGLFVVLTPLLGAAFLRQRIAGSAWIAAAVSTVGSASA